MRPTLPRLPAEDGLAIWNAEPGDVLPDGRIATALSVAQPFEYVAGQIGGVTDELAVTTRNPRYAAQMLGYSSQQFREMVHRFKDENTIGPTDDLTWHDNGDVYFQNIYIDNFHGYKD
ncbi:hypothetical protein AWB80_06354 [Caballeronia pedi]|uniref:Uncharacterized protein n=1 Tax=Caballeronia pedi TaxID=1777141 RepID=A0A158D837_9BURK|nr:hypothetical protein AWB80_06354 [Caballeronia pedi]